MNKFSFDNARLLFASAISYLMAFFSPVVDSLYALLIVFAFNIFCGMLSDGVTIPRCTNFSGKKISHALFEFLIYITINFVLFSTVTLQGSPDVAPVLITSITWIMVYIYLSNSLRNLIKAYPKNLFFRVIYHLIRFEFKKMVPSSVRVIIDRITRFEEDRINQELNTDKDKKKDCE